MQIARLKTFIIKLHKSIFYKNNLKFESAETFLTVVEAANFCFYNLHFNEFLFAIYRLAETPVELEQKLFKSFISLR